MQVSGAMILQDSARGKRIDKQVGQDCRVIKVAMMSMEQ